MNDNLLLRLGAPPASVAHTPVHEALGERDLSRPLQLPWRCKICGRRFNSEELRDHHFLRHGELPFECPARGCAATFRNESMLHKHAEEMHPGQLMFVCDSCGQGFQTCCALHQHSERHSQLLLCPEPSCGQEFGSRIDLMDHRQAHMGLVSTQRMRDLGHGLLEAARMLRSDKEAAFAEEVAATPGQSAVPAMPPH